MSDFVAQIRAELTDVSKVESQIKNLSKTPIKLNVDTSDIQRQIQNALKGMKINLNFGGSSGGGLPNQLTGHISDDIANAVQGGLTKGVGKMNGRTVTSGISKNIEQEISKAVNNAVGAKSQLVSWRANTRTEFDDARKQNVSSVQTITVKYRTENGEDITKQLTKGKIGTDSKGNDLMGWVESAGQVSQAYKTASESVDTFINKQKTAVSKANDTLNQIKVQVNDKNVSKPIQDQGNLDALTTKYQEVTNAISAMGTASKDTFTDSQNAVNTQISELKQMVTQYRNAENVATSLRTKDFDTVKTEQWESLVQFKEKIKGSNVPIDEMKTSLTGLFRQLAQAGDAESLTKWMNDFDVAVAKFKTRSQELKTAASNEKLGVKTSALGSKIDNLAQYAGVDKFEAEINGAKVTIESLKKELASVGSQGDLRVVTEKFKAFQDQAKAAGLEISDNAEKQAKAIEKITTAVANGKLESDLSKAAVSFNKFSDNLGNAEVDKLKTKFEDLKRASRELSNEIAKPDGDVVGKYNQYQNALQSYNNQLTVVRNSVGQLASATSKQTLSNQMTSWMNSNTKALDLYGDKITELQQRLQRSDLTKVQYQDIANQFKAINAEAKALGVTGQSLGDRWKSAFQSISHYVSASALLYKGIRTMKQMVSAVKEVDSSMTELYRVTDLTSSQYTEMYDKMAESAVNYGTSVSDMVSSTASWVKLGFNENDSMDLAKLTAQYQHVTDLDNDTAVNNLVTAYKGFQDQLLAQNNGDSVQAVEQISDIYDKLGNEFAESAADVGDGLSKSASVLAQAGADIEQSAGMFTGIQEVIQNSSTAGQALKIYSLRIRGGQLFSLHTRKVCMLCA